MTIVNIFEIIYSTKSLKLCMNLLKNLKDLHYFHVDGGKRRVWTKDEKNKITMFNTLSTLQKPRVK